MNSSSINWTALSVFIFFFVLVTVMGFWASRWQSGGKSNKGAHLDEWGLGGRNFGTWITWFLVGGDFYTAYTVIAVPALVYAVGAYGFFALPYTILVYPFVFMVMPKLWQRRTRTATSPPPTWCSAATARAGWSSPSP
jgi:SSS family solute:Na+ symporter